MQIEITDDSIGTRQLRSDATLGETVEFDDDGLAEVDDDVGRSLIDEFDAIERSDSQPDSDVSLTEESNNASDSY